MPRSLDGEAIARNSATIAAAIAEVNAELTAAAGGAQRPGPARGAADAAAGERRPGGGRAGGDGRLRLDLRRGRAAVRPARAAAAEPAAIEVASTGTTGGNDWGVQLGAYRAKGDAERQLLTTALKDVPELSGGLRRVEAAKVQGVTVYRAQFVGLSQADALGRLREPGADAGGLPAAGAGDLSRRSRRRRAARGTISRIVSPGCSAAASMSQKP